MQFQVRKPLRTAASTLYRHCFRRGVCHLVEGAKGPLPVHGDWLVVYKQQVASTDCSGGGSGTVMAPLKLRELQVASHRDPISEALSVMKHAKPS